MTASSRLCGAVTAAGRPCRRKATTAAGSCPQHPPSLSPGEQLRVDVLGVYELTDPERQLLAAACSTVDTIVDLERAIETDGTMVDGSKGQPVLHPAVAELRQQRLALGRLLSQLALPDPETGDMIKTPETVRAATAARQRWRASDRAAAVLGVVR